MGDGLSSRKNAQNDPVLQGCDAGDADDAKIHTLDTHKREKSKDAWLKASGGPGFPLRPGSTYRRKNTIGKGSFPVLAWKSLTGQRRSYSGLKKSRRFKGHPGRPAGG
jgi:hypothetical protein